MDRADRLINNRTPRYMILIYIFLLILAAAGSAGLSVLLTDHILGNQIDAMLSVLGGGSFTDVPDPDAVAAGEAFVSRYGIRAGMNPRIMRTYHSLQNLLFWVIFLFSGILCTLGLHISLRQLRPIYRDLEQIQAECVQIAEQKLPAVGMYGEEFSCIRRVCDGVNLIAKRMNALSGRLTKEKQYLKEFLTDFSHQVKTSLAVIRLNSDMIADMDKLSEEQKALLSQEISMHLEGMETLVIAALKLAKLNADAVIYEMNDVSLSDTCLEAVRRVQPMMRTKGIAVTFSAEPDVQFRHDRTWLCEAIENLLKNIADHSQCRHADLELSAIPGAVKLCISDDGKGIPQSEIPKLFERFGQKNHNVSMQNAGVGMAIAKKIIEAHGGEICVYSQIGKGTKFEILFLK